MYRWVDVQIENRSYYIKEPQVIAMVKPWPSISNKAAYSASTVGDILIGVYTTADTAKKAVEDYFAIKPL